ncbi:MAG: hypothetical protein VR69_14850 [Peptococcaceae bacterium BRH_c4b]|nr:MAG: hypothetical protein VR69_14850 [Peptococcaceae bacterium BRH_c4b]
MFRKLEKQLYLEEFVLPFEGKLRADNRWVKLAKIIPWDTIEDRYAKFLPATVDRWPNPYGWLSVLSSSKKSVDTATARQLSRLQRTRTCSIS